MVIIERHGSNKLENKLCSLARNCTESQSTPKEVHASTRLRGRSAADAIDLGLFFQETSYLNSHTSAKVDRLRSGLLSAWIQGSNSSYDEPLLRSSRRTCTPPSSQPSLSRPYRDCSVARRLNASSTAILSSYTLPVNSSSLQTTKSLLPVQTTPPLDSNSQIHSSIYLQKEDVHFHRRKRKKTSVLSDLTSSIYAYIRGYKKLRLYVLYVILIVCALVEGCLSSSMCSESPKVLPGFLSVDLNQTSVGLEHGQCLSVTNEFVESICDLPKVDRMKAIRKVNTNFCGLPLYNILNDTEKTVVEQCSPGYGCASTLQYIYDLDLKLKDIYCSFSDIVSRMDCEDSFSYNGNCDSCRGRKKPGNEQEMVDRTDHIVEPNQPFRVYTQGWSISEEAYKYWLCSVHFEYYQGGLEIKPCIQVCDQVSRSCPFFRPYGDTHIGEPGFLCKDLTIHHENAAALYGQEKCCFEPCQVFIMEDWNQGCPPLNVTSNCVPAITQNQASTPPGLNLFLALCVLVTWIIRALSRYSCIGLT